ncbi:hypothetical protein [Chitinilyticum litopenaei]|uniref:hypothetical protein n=1 Tax=Chitinilyticum litopenaei TaxID=1121276 RepID=UPI0004093C3F|nr:hypothetical protein [Chitinilyticum litopenaei]
MSLHPEHRYWLYLPPHEAIDPAIEALAAHWQPRLRGRVSVQEGRAVLVSNLRVWENIALPAWYHQMAEPADLEERLQAKLALLDWDEAELLRFLHALPQALEPAQRRLVQLLRGLLADARLLLADADWWRLAEQPGLLRRQLDQHGELALLVVSHQPVPAGFCPWDETASGVLSAYLSVDE